MAMGDVIIIVESGATKSDWRILDADGKIVKRFSRPGINISTMMLEDVERTLKEAFIAEELVEASGCFFLYTAGVVTWEIRAAVARLIKSVSRITEIDVQDDLLGAARAVCGHEPGIAAILGTGSNACYYDGVTITRAVYSGGFILGDEGSAAALGKMFLADYIKGLVPSSLVDSFRKEFDTTYAGIVEGVYQSSSPSGYLGSFAPFLVRHASDAYVDKLLDQNFQSFVDRILLRYDATTYPVGIVGGFGWACKDRLLSILKQNGILSSRFLKAPIDGLCEYHRINKS